MKTAPMTDAQRELYFELAGAAFSLTWDLWERGIGGFVDRFFVNHQALCEELMGNSHSGTNLHLEVLAHQLATLAASGDLPTKEEPRAWR
jgi:hypothetical protein